MNEEQSSEFGFSKLFGSATKNKANLKATSKIEKPDIKHISMTPGDLGKRYMSCLIINVSLSSILGTLSQCSRRGVLLLRARVLCGL